MSWVEIPFWILGATIAYIYVGYPVLLLAVRALRGVKPVRQGDCEPTVTLIISAFNEAGVIEDKLRNSLSLEYPREALDIVVVSDASTDGTDDIVERMAAQGIRLLRMSERSGKTAGLNRAVGQSSSEVVVFSDANAMYEKSAVRMLVRNFADPDVGAVIGESSYGDIESAADRTESSYWRYETLIKRLETHIGSVVGGDGAIYAIRRGCYRPMPHDALSDFVNPLQIVEQGYRCVYEPAALSVEQGAGRFDKEFNRKVRIVNRAWRAAMSMKEMLNPFKYGLFALQFISHKLLRWLVPFFLAALLVVNIAAADLGPIYAMTLAAQGAFYGLAIGGFVLQRRISLPFLLSMPYYFCLVNLAAVKGIAEACFGKSYVTWSTVRAD